jgi:hypothetical protein
MLCLIAAVPAALGTSAHAATTGGTLSIGASTYSVLQNAGSEAITVVRAGGSSGAASVVCKTSDGTAHAGAQYTAVNATLQWADGDASPKHCTIPISAANPFTGGLNFTVALSAASGGALGSPGTTTVTIIGNYGAGSATLSAPTYSVAQNAGMATLTVNRTGGSKGAAMVRYATANVTAVAGTDYSARQDSIHWADGDTAPKTARIMLSNATPFSGSKTFALAIASPENITLGTTTSAIVTIVGSAAPVVGSATLTWLQPTENTDGSPLTNLAGYKIYYGNSASALSNVIQVANPATLEYEISNLAAGTWYFAVKAYTTGSVESALSSMASKTI